MAMNRMRKASARLLIDKASGHSIRIDWLKAARHFGTFLVCPIQRKGFYDRAATERDLLGTLDNPATFSVKEQLVLSRANIRRRAAKIRPRLKGG